MKKMTFAAVFMMAVAVIGTSCTKTQTTPAEPGTAKLTLEMQLNTNEGNDTLPNGNALPGGDKNYENNFPSDFKVQFIIDSEKLQANPTAGFVYDKLTSTGTYNSSTGKVTVDLPAIAIPHDVEVKFPDLELNRTYRLPAGFGMPARDTSVMKVWTKSTETYTIWDGAVLIKEDIRYSY